MNPRGRNSSSFSNDAARLPALPTVRVSDPAMQRFIDAVSEWISVRSGSRQDKFERAVTVRDLVDLGLLDAGSLGRGTLSATPGPAGTSDPSLIVQTDKGNVRMTIDAFTRSIMDTQLFRNLMLSLRDPKRFDGLPEAVRELLLQDIRDEAAKRGADVRRLETKIQTETQSLATLVEEVTASLGTAVAGVRTTAFASATASQAAAGQITQISAAIGDPGTFTANGVTLEEAMFGIASLDQGLYGQYTLKINANNHIAGFGLAVEARGNNDATSAFIVAADKFAVVAAGDTIADPLNPPISRVPFGIDTTNNTIFINGNVRINAGGTKLEDVGASTVFALAVNAGAIRRNASNVYVPATITLSATATTGSTPAAYTGRFRIETSPDGTTWTNRYDSAANESSYTWTVTPATGITQVRCRLYQAGGFTTLLDEQVLPIVVDGAVGADGRPAITVIVQNASHTVPADNAGNVTSYANSGVRISVWEGSTPLTFNTSDIGGASRFYVGGPVIDAGTITAGLYTAGAGTSTFESADHSGMTTDVARIRRMVTLRRSDGILDSGSYPAVQTITKARQGAQGAQGPQGPTGAAGDPGARGSLTGNGAQYSISTASWVDGLANRVINNMLTNETLTATLATTTHLRIGDSVTLGNGSTFAETRYWAGAANGWLQPGVTINGNLIVNGTVVADKIGTNAITADKIEANALNGKIITGSLIRTAASGARIELDSSGNRLVGLDAGGTARFTWSASLGTLTVNGTTGGWLVRVDNATTSFGDTIYGVTSGTGSGVRGQSTAGGSGVLGTSVSGPGVFGQSTSGPGGRFSSLRVDNAVETAATGTATFNGTKPGTTKTNAWLRINVNGTDYLIPVWEAS